MLLNITDISPKSQNRWRNVYSNRKKQARETLVKRIQYAISRKRRAPQNRTTSEHERGARSTHLEVAIAEEEINLDPLSLLERVKHVVDYVQLHVHAAVHRDLHWMAQ